MKSFASDNYAGVHPKIMEAMLKANSAHQKAYGEDELTSMAKMKFKEIFGEDSEAFFVYNGTAANVTGLKSIVKSHEAIVCTQDSHLYNDECGAPETAIGAKLIALPSTNAKLTVDALKEANLDEMFGFVHWVQPKVISITQVTEMGTLYSVEEIKAIADFAHQRGMFLHMDGARLSNAALALDLDFAEFTVKAGVDILSFGGTKNGMMFGEAVVFLGLNRTAEEHSKINELKEAAQNFPFVRKNCMQLNSKMRFIAAQFLALFEDDLWKKNAQHSNQMAQLLHSKIKDHPELKLATSFQANGLFVEIPSAWLDTLTEAFPFYVWSTSKDKSVVRWMTSFDTTEEEIEAFAKLIQSITN